MSNHLRELLEQEVIFYGNGRTLSPEAVSNEVKKLVESAENAMCFDLVDAREVVWGRHQDNMPVDLPFKTCWFEFSLKTDNFQHALFGVMCDTTIPGDAKLNSFVRINGEWQYLFTVTTHSNFLKMTSNDNFEVVKIEFHRLILGTIRNALCAIGCVNVNRLEHAPDAKLQKARMARGKKPLFSYWTLELRPSRADGDARGGTHTAPRLHLRRGHPRQFAPDKWTWVQPCVVGNKALGIVHKDYRLGGGAPPA